MMWKQIYEFGKQLFTLTERTEQNQQGLKEMRQELDELTTAVHQLYFEFQLLRENVTNEQEKTLLKLENALLKVQLPPIERKQD